MPTSSGDDSFAGSLVQAIEPHSKKLAWKIFKSGLCPRQPGSVVDCCRKSGPKRFFVNWAFHTHSGSYNLGMSFIRRLPVVRGYFALREACKEFDSLERALGLGGAVSQAGALSSWDDWVRISQGAEFGSKLDRVRSEIERLKYFGGLRFWDAGTSLPSPQNGLVRETDNTATFWAEVRKELEEIRAFTALEVGPGVRPINLREFEYIICVEPFKPYLRILTERYRGSNVIPIHGTAPRDLARFADQSVDSVFLIDVVEHLEKDAGLQTIKECERIARKSVHVFTPLGFMEQHVGALDDDGWGFSGNILQTHLSGWEPDDFEDWRILIHPTYHTTETGNHGAMWATMTKVRPQSAVSLPLAVDIVIPAPLDYNVQISLFVEQALRDLDVSNIWVHPELAPWSFRAKPTISLPSDLARILPLGLSHFKKPIILIGDAVYGSAVKHADKLKLLRVVSNGGRQAAQQNQTSVRNLDLNQEQNWGRDLAWLVDSD